MAAYCTGRKALCILWSQPRNASVASVGKRLVASAAQGSSKNTPDDAKKPPPSAASKPAPPVPPNVSGATQGYKVKEYFEYSPYSFYDIHADMSKMRLPQPSSRK
uniref:Phytanoyl-CoA hydroxylase n=1 Tax=Rhipicephalus appendiculatus TaxID=34631 RepID=A0A131YP90_RHIAP